MAIVNFSDDIYISIAGTTHNVGYFQCTTSGELKHLVLTMNRENMVVGTTTVTAKVYSDHAREDLLDTSDTVSLSSVDTSGGMNWFGKIRFDFNSINLIAGKKYYVTVEAANYSPSDSSYFGWQLDWTPQSNTPIDEYNVSVRMDVYAYQQPDQTSNSRYCLARVEAIKNLNGLLTEGPAGYWSATIDFHPFEVSHQIYDDVTTIDEDVDLATDDTWTYDFDTKLLTVRTGLSQSAPSYLKAKHYWFLTNTQEHEEFVTPGSGGATALWLDRIKNSPKITESIENTMDGTITTSGSGMTLENSDHYFNSIFNPVIDSLQNAKIVIWFNIGGMITKQFTGFIRTVDITGTTVALGLLDNTSLLDLPAYASLDPFLSIISDDDPLYTVRDADVGKPIPLVLGGTPRTLSGDVFDYEATNQISPTLQVSKNLAEFYDPDSMISATCISYNSTASVSYNRQWVLCRGMGDPVELNWGSSLTIITAQPNKTVAAGTPGVGDINVTHFSRTSPMLGVGVTGTHNLKVGDVGMTYDSVALKYVAWCVIRVESDAYTVIAIPEDGDETYLPPAVTANWTSRFTLPSPGPALTVIAKGPNGLCVIPPSKYSVYQETPSSGASKYRITLEHSNVNYENISGTPITPDTTKILCALRLEDNASKHGDVVDMILTTAGYEVDAASITAANSIYTYPDLQYMIPSGNAREYPQLRTVLGEICKTTNGYIRFDSAGKAYYSIFSPASASGEVRDDDIILSSTLIPKVDYYSMSRKFFMSNKHAGSGQGTTYYNYEVSLSEAWGLHGVIKETNREVLWRKIGNSNTYNHMLFGKPRVTYEWQSDIADYNTTLGDDVTITGTNLLGDVESVNVKVIKTVKSLDSIQCTGLKLTGD